MTSGAWSRPQRANGSESQRSASTSKMLLQLQRERYGSEAHAQHHEATTEITNYRAKSKMAAIHLRMLGYSVSLAMHGYNLFMMDRARHGPAMADDNIKTFAAMYRRFFTVWTITIQIFYAILGLSCDCLTLRNTAKKEPVLLNLMKSFKSLLFAAVLWPTVFLESSLFWSLYHYDRSLIFPLYADKFLTRTANHIVHTAVVPVVLWEVVFQPRVVPKNHVINLTLLTTYMLTYLSVMCYTYFEQGVWMYPIFGLAYDSIVFFPVILGIIGVALYIYYHMQWFLTQIIWGKESKNKQS